MAKKTKRRLHKLKNSDEYNVHSVFENELEVTATVNCEPEDREAVTEAVEDLGFTVISYEELEDSFDGTRFTRIKLSDEELQTKRASE